MDDPRLPRRHEPPPRGADVPWWLRLLLPFRTADITTAPTSLERPWRQVWDYLPKRSAGAGFSDREYAIARHRAEMVARTTLGEDLWRQFRRDGYLEVRSRIFPGITYRLRVGRRIEVRCDPAVTSPWRHPWLCINPVYPLPEIEFFAHLYLYTRDLEEEIVRVAAPQPWDQALGRTF